MLVLLLKDVPNVGHKGQTVNVSSGYYRNFLVPRKLATVATDKLVAHVQTQKSKEGEKLEARKDSALRIQEKLNGQSIRLKERANESGKLFAAIHEKELVEAIEKEHKVILKPENILISEAMKNLGDYEITLKLFEGIQAKMAVHVSA